MAVKTKGLIIKEQSIRESDRLVTLLTANYGVLRAFVHGAKRINSKLSCVSLFCYGEFTLHQSKDAYIITEVENTQVFFELRSDLIKLSLAQYFAQLTLELTEGENDSGEVLRLVLNAMHLLCKGKVPYTQIKAVVELRMLTLGGYMPNILGCERCGVFESEPIFFHIQTGHFYCNECNQNGGIPLSAGTLTAMRHICLSEVQKVFSFTLQPDSLRALCDCNEQYLLGQLERRFSTLEFYKSVL